MSINKDHPNYSKHPALKGRIVSESKGPNRASRRGGKYRQLPKQFHLQGKAQLSMMFKERGLVSKKS